MHRSLFLQKTDCLGNWAMMGERPSGPLMRLLGERSGGPGMLLGYLGRSWETPVLAWAGEGGTQRAWVRGGRVAGGHGPVPAGRLPGGVLPHGHLPRDAHGAPRRPWTPGTGSSGPRCSSYPSFRSAVNMVSSGPSPDAASFVLVFLWGESSCWGWGWGRWEPLGAGRTRPWKRGTPDRSPESRAGDCLAPSQCAWGPAHREPAPPG